MPYGVYTGQTAAMDLGVGPQRSTRGEIRRALEQGAIRIVFCSDAASEGVNLQSARTLINVDVPWNPARLEQRIGRIARLGQKASSVDVYNLWYPDSIEAKMYKRLIERKDLYELAVGEFPEVISAAIRADVSSRFGGQTTASDPLAQLQRLRNDMQVNALRKLWARDSTGDTLAHKFRAGLAALAVASVLGEHGRVHESADRTDLEVEGEIVSSRDRSRGGRRHLARASGPPLARSSQHSEGKPAAPCDHTARVSRSSSARKPGDPGAR